MADRTIRVTLRAEVGQYKQAMTEAAKATAEVGSQSTVATSALGRMVQSARSNREAWTTTGTALLAVGAAITGIGVAALKTGIEYNTLQQTSRAALTTLLGSAEAANAQMDKLDDFARTSPFAKGVFIQAQQQMLGFGIEAGKVIPYLDSIQNAVAAMGGSNNDISELTRIMSQISASSKITAMDLREFGNRGVDAATIIGSQMGKTGAQIRDDITAGTLDAQVALDALSAGMDVRFGGAADNVKNTFLGAMDRVKAAWRDLSSELATGLVDPNGGGGLVDWLNDMATAMRGFQNAPEWVKATTIGLVGLVGVTALLGGGAMLLVPRLVALYDALGSMGPVGIKAQAGMKGFANALPTASKVAGLAVAVGAIAYATGQLVDSLTGGVAVLGANELAAALDDVVTSGGDLSKLDAAFQNTGKVLGMSKVEADSLTEAFDQMLNPSVTDNIAGLFDGILPVTGYMETLEERVSAVDAALTAMVTAGDIDSVNEFTDAMLAAGYTAEDINRLLPQTKDALIGVAEAQDEVTPATEGATVATEELSAEVEAATEKFKKWLEVVAAADAAFIDVQGGYDAVIAKNQEIAQSTADATEDAEDSWEDYYDGMSVSASDYIAQLAEQVAAQEAWETNMVTIAERVNAGMTGEMRVAAREMIDELLALGPEGAAQVELLASMTDAELSEVVRLWSNKGESAVTEFNGQMAKLVNPTLVLNMNTDPAYAAVDSFRRTVSGMTVYVNVAGQEVGFSTGRGNRTGRAYGGPVPGSSPHARADNVMIRATAGEWVHQVPAVNYWGPSFMDAVNRMDKAAVASSIAGHAYGGQVGMPAFAMGGYVGASAASAGGGPLVGVAIEGTLDLGGGLVGVMRGVVKSELSEAGSRARYAGGS